MTKRKSFLLRLDPRLWDELSAWADQELRSINGQIEFLLRDAVRRRRNKDAVKNSTDDHDEG
ncbi:MAG: Arc family DNA binding domain-containing protein [bacterium]|nr:Arc family DNA binding domain-containing protein [bacterium]